MQIQVEPPQVTDVDAASWREWVERRVRFVLRRLRADLMLVQVRLVDVNGPRGGVDQRCQLSMATEAGGTVVVSATHGKAAGALNAALRRATTALLRQFQKHRRSARQTRRHERLALAPESPAV